MLKQHFAPTGYAASNFCDSTTLQLADDCIASIERVLSGIPAEWVRAHDESQQG